MRSSQATGAYFSIPHAQAAHPCLSVRGPRIPNCLCAARIRPYSYVRIPHTRICLCAAAHPLLSMRGHTPAFAYARPHTHIRPCAAVTRLQSHNCTVPLTSSFIASSSRFTLSQEIDQPLSQPVPTPPSAQVPPRQQQTPPGADVATQRSVAALLTQDPDVPMSSLTAYRASPPRLEDVASSQDILDPDADGDDDPSTASRVPPPRAGSALDGSSFPLLGFSPSLRSPPSRSHHLLSPHPSPPHSQTPWITTNSTPLFTLVRSLLLFPSISYSLPLPSPFRRLAS